MRKGIFPFHPLRTLEALSVAGPDGTALAKVLMHEPENAAHDILPLKTVREHAVVSATPIIMGFNRFAGRTHRCLERARPAHIGE